MSGAFRGRVFLQDVSHQFRIQFVVARAQPPFDISIQASLLIDGVGEERGEVMVLMVLVAPEAEPVVNRLGAIPGAQFPESGVLRVVVEVKRAGVGRGGAAPGEGGGLCVGWGDSGPF